MNITFTLIALTIVAGILLAVAIRAAGGNLTLVDHWAKALKHYSTYGLTLVAFLPEVFNELVQGGYVTSGEVSETFSWLNKGAVLLTFLVLKLKQAPKPVLPKFDPTDQAGT